MATENSLPSQLDDKVLNTGESGKVVEGEGVPEAKGELSKEKDGNWPFTNSEPMREEQVQNAVKFLSHPKVRGSPVIYRRSFLERKGLTKEEIDEAFRRVPDPPSNELPAKATVQSQDTRSSPPSTVQTQPPVQTLQPTVAPLVTTSTAPLVQPTRFHWTHMIFAVGLLTATGAGAGVLFKNAVIPKLKAWIRQVTSEADETERKKALEPSPAAEAAAAAKAAALAASEVANVSRELVKSRIEDRKYFEGLLRSVEGQIEEMKSMKTALQYIQSNRHGFHTANGILDDQVESETHMGKSNGTLGAISSIKQVDWRGISESNSKNVKVDADVRTVDQGSVRPSSAPASVEPSLAPHSKSYMEVLAMVERGEKPPGIQEINDKPPNPNQPPSNPRLKPKLKPWEQIQVQNNNGIPNAHAQFLKVGNSSGLSEGAMPVGNGFSTMQTKSTTVSVSQSDNTDLWWRRRNESEFKAVKSQVAESSVKITEMETGDDGINGSMPGLSSSSSVSGTFDGPGSKPLHSLSGRSWVPPPTPPLAMAQAAEAIRHPKSKVKQEELEDRTEAPNSSMSDLRQESTNGQFTPLDSMIQQEEAHVSPSSDLHELTDNRKEEVNGFSTFTEENSYEKPLYKEVTEEDAEETEGAHTY